MIELSRIAAFLGDAARLKFLERKAYVRTRSRRKNSAEHSWHLALACELNVDIWNLFFLEATPTRAITASGAKPREANVALYF